jgi:D-alanyl-lipoteichoic acid acyltransferase DltB (MBOAT superfamily)
VAGPIVRAADFLPQLDGVRRFAEVPVRACLVLFLIGYFKKACVSDNIAPLIDPVFAKSVAYGSEALVAAVLLYAVQIYCDFSGYSDMALALAGLLGYRLPLNFAWPYFADGIIDFWRRWHMSLSTWLRDYLYIPLGGNRHGALMRYRNLLLTMVLGGLWHGASWNFVIWGALHGLLLALAHGWRDFGPGRAGPPATWAPFARVGRIALTFYFVSLAWIFFRAPDLVTAWPMVQAWLGLPVPGDAVLPLDPWPWLAGLAGLHLLTWYWPPERHAERLAPLAFGAAYGATAALALAFLQTDYRPFVYFQF